MPEGPGRTPGPPGGPGRLRVVRLATLRFVLLAALLSFATPAAAQSPSASGGGLFVQSASQGRLVPVPGRPGVFNLTLRVPGPVVAFADRPARRVRNESLASFAARWTRRGFAADPPNAALVIDDAPAARDVVVLELRSRTLVRAGIVRYRVRILRGTAAGPALARVVAGRADRTARRAFGRASLFVDPSRPESVSLNLAFSPLAAGAPGGLYFGDSAQVSPVVFTTLQSPGTVVVALNAFFLTPGASGLPATTAQVGLVNASSPIRGTAQLPIGVTVTASVSVAGTTGPSTTISNGPFSLPIPK